MATALAQAKADEMPSAATTATGRAVLPDGVQTMALAPQGVQGEEPAPFPALISRLPVELGVSIPVRDFRLRQLLTLTAGQLIETQWNHGEDLPLAAHGVQLAWSEFEVVESSLAVRITRLL